MKLFIVLLLLYNSIDDGLSKEEKYVRIGLDAKWREVGLHFEAR